MGNALIGLTPLEWLLLVVGLLALAAGVQRSRYDGIPPRAWWAQERMHRRPWPIVGRLGKAIAGAACLVGACTALLALVGVLLVAAVLAGAAFATWYGLRRAASAVAPRVMPVERIDIALCEKPAHDVSPSPIPRGETPPPNSLEV
ncbi:hypothetical protein IMZ11_02170 [Microtetraspora sp. AC03309]|uniref:hypothetical protein n=1 Tax=Microtetraspora sp. AC03309 TaxID=2779376 RepID=UPI001E569505|nr:hypothetical protein [Microtetraspora sp. AC03309]MCC5574446.1 hypothetical protein [Microtetraspora sp. AC03309]